MIDVNHHTYMNIEYILSAGQLERDNPVILKAIAIFSPSFAISFKYAFLCCSRWWYSPVGFRRGGRQMSIR